MEILIVTILGIGRVVLILGLNNTRPVGTEMFSIVHTLPDGRIINIYIFFPT
jgi:hypothetical protein